MFIVVNLKSVLKLSDMENYINNLNIYEKLIIAPSSSYFHLFDKSLFNIASQDITCSNNGAYTGEITSDQLADMNISYVLVGHGERRNHFLEDESIFIKKINNAHKNNIEVIFFIGELSRCSKTELYDILKEQIISVFEKVNFKNIIVAYEPFYAIGKKNTFNISEIEEVIIIIKTIIKDTYNFNTKVIYGGGLDITDVDLIRHSNVIDGIAISKIALDVDNLNKIIDMFSK